MPKSLGLQILSHSLQKIVRCYILKTHQAYKLQHATFVHSNILNRTADQQSQKNCFEIELRPKWFQFENIVEAFNFLSSIGLNFDKHNSQ